MNGDAICGNRTPAWYVRGRFANRDTRGETGMRKVLIPVVVVALAIAAAAVGGRGEVAAAAACAAAPRRTSTSSSDGQLTIGTDNPAFPPWFAGGETKGRPWKINDPAKGQGFESAVAYAVAKRLGFTKDEVVWVVLAVQQVDRARARRRSTSTSTRSRTRRSARRRSTSAPRYYDVNQSIVGAQGQADRVGALDRRPQATTSSARSSGRRATSTSSATSSRASRPPSTTRTTPPSRH